MLKNLQQSQADAFKTSSNRVIQKQKKAQATGHLIGKKIGDRKIDRFKQTTKIRC